MSSAVASTPGSAYSVDRIGNPLLTLLSPTPPSAMVENWLAVAITEIYIYRGLKMMRLICNKAQILNIFQLLVGRISIYS